MNITKVKVAFHRNGVAGSGFHVVLFNWKDEDKVTRRMVATMFETPGDYAVLDIDETAKGNIGFAHGNSWRGDRFELCLRTAIDHYEKMRSSV